MAYKLFEDFSVKTISNDSYFFSVENETRYSDLHGVIKDGGYLITTDYSKHLLKTPSISEFNLSFEMQFVCPCSEIKIVNFFFGYDRVLRTGYAVKFTFIPQTNNQLKISLLSIDGIVETVIDTTIINDFCVEEEKDFCVEFVLKNKKMSGKLNNAEFAFEVPNSCSGLVGFSDSSAVGGIKISNLLLNSQENPAKQTVLAPITLKTPMVSGAPQPYYVTLDISRYEGCSYDLLSVEFFGGSGEENEQDIDEDCWLFTSDSITDPFLRLVTDDVFQKINIWNDTGNFVAKNEFHGVVEGYRVFNENREYPFKKVFPIERVENVDSLMLSFGYESAITRGVADLGGKHEYLFNTKGELLWDGKTFDEPIIAETQSPADKRIVSLIPKDIPNYNRAVNHAKGNHYFFDDEELQFTINLLTEYPVQTLSLKVRFETVYGEKICDIATNEFSFEEFLINKYKVLKATISHPPMETGVYHLVYDVFVGSEMVYSHTSAFEVFSENSNISPQEAVGLPEIHVGDGGPLRLKTTVPDFFSECRDSNINHYVSCAMYLPIFAENSRVWELLKLYKRKWFLWFNQRTIGRNKDYKNFPNCIKNADYINYLYPVVEESLGNWCRHDMWRYSVYTAEMRSILAEFLKENPEIAKTLNFGDVTKEYTEEMHRRLFDVCSDKWLQFAKSKITIIFEKQWSRIEEVNPNAKHSSYGPVPFYSSQYKTAYSTKFFAQDSHALEKVMDGFWQFEDYPTWCNYSFGEGAFSLMTYKLYSPNAIIRPEVYCSLRYYCPDGFVGRAHPLRENYYKPPYVQMAQILEYAYNTAYFKNGKFDYWRDNQYMMHFLPDDKQTSVLELLEAQRKILNYKPLAPKKSVVFVVDFNADEDVLDYKIHHDSIYNKSEANICYLNSVCRNSGIPVGAGTDFDGLLGLSAEQIDILVLPSLKHAKDEVIDHIRTLYENGVSLFAAGDVSGLEDVFGVTENRINVKINEFVSKKSKETVLSVNNDFIYAANDAQVLISADGKHPVLLKNDRAVLLNICVSRAGIDSYNPSYIGRPNISKLLRKICIETFRSISNPIAIVKVGNGIVAFSGEDGCDYLYVSDLSGLGKQPRDYEKANKVLIELKEGAKKLVPMDLKCNQSIQLSKVNNSCFGMVELLPMQGRLFKVKK